jgi:DNA-binding XRE family transcriptional regulator
MKTAFGRHLAKMRVDFNERQADMAKRLDVAPSFLSAIENGKKTIPLNLLQTLCKSYELDYQQRRIVASNLCGLRDSIQFSTGELPCYKVFAIMTILLDCYD